MHGRDSCVLTTKDYAILETMLDRHIGDTTILRRKIAAAQVVFREDIAPTVVTLNSRVTYRIDAGPAETRVITHDDTRGLVGVLLPITNPRGLALLGLGEGQSITIRKTGGSEETLCVQDVAYQPEAAGREHVKLKQETAEPSAPARPIFRIVQGSLSDKPKPKALATIEDGPDDFDPGPSAA